MPIPQTDERIVVTGEVVSIKAVASRFAQRVAEIKLLVQCDGYRLYGTCPKFKGELPQRGDRIEFTAQVIPSPDDPEYGYFKRPTKPSYTPGILSKYYGKGVQK